MIAEWGEKNWKRTREPLQLHIFPQMLVWQRSCNAAAKCRPSVLPLVASTPVTIQYGYIHSSLLHQPKAEKFEAYYDGLTPKHSFCPPEIIEETLTSLNINCLSSTDLKTLNEKRVIFKQHLILPGRSSKRVINRDIALRRHFETHTHARVRRDLCNNSTYHFWYKPLSHKFLRSMTTIWVFHIGPWLVIKQSSIRKTFQIKDTNDSSP